MLDSGLPPNTRVVHQEGISFLLRLKTNSLLLSGGQVGPPSGKGWEANLSGPRWPFPQSARPHGPRGVPEHREELQPQSPSLTLWREALLRSLPRPGARLEMGWVTEGHGLPLFLQPVPAPPPFPSSLLPLRMFSGVSTKSLPLPLLLSCS